MKNILSIGLLWLLLPVKSFSQDKSPVSGMVVNDAREPVNGVTIGWKNKGIGSITNNDGKFVILLPAPYLQTDSLTFSCIGYKPRRISIQHALATQNNLVILHSFVGNLKEVTVKPLSLKQLLDSITHHNALAFISPMKLNGYYRELVFTNARCTAYADAICEYYYDRFSQPDGLLRISASRCLKEKKINDDENNMEVYKESTINPNMAFKYTMLSAMLEKYLPAKSLTNYEYDIKESADAGTDDVQVIILPKTTAGDDFYKLTFILKPDFTLKSYRLEIPENLAARVKERSLLGIHIRVSKLVIDVHYSPLLNGIYPDYYSIIKDAKISGHFLGTSIDQAIENKSEFITGEAVTTGDFKAFAKQDIYKKGNICNNGAVINDALLKKYTIIMPSQKDSISLNLLNN